VSDAAVDARIRELEAKLARATHERDEYRKLYELVMLELERVKRHLRAQNKSEKVDAARVQLAFAEVANLIVPPELAAQIADDENK
jgi:transposase